MYIKREGKNIMALKKLTKISEDEKLLCSYADEYSEISKKMKLLDNTKKSLSERIKDILSNVGVKDSNGSQYYETSKFILGRVARKKITLDKDAVIAYLEKNDKNLLNRVLKVETVVNIDEDALEEAVREGEIPMEVFENEMCKIDVSYSVSVKEKEDIPEVEVSKAKAALRK